MLFRSVGIEFGTRKLVVLGPGGQRVQTDLPWDGRSAIDLQVRLDRERGEVEGQALGVTVRAPLPKGFAPSAIGYGATDTETAFSPLRTP